MNQTELSYQPLSDDKVERIARKYYEQKAVFTEERAQPVALFVAGQSGAGKTQVSNQESKKIEGGYILVDADRMREEIPHAGNFPSNVTQEDAGKLVANLRNRVVAGKRNFVEEGTFRNSDVVSNAVEALKSSGYRVEMVAVAANFEQSLLGIYERYERQIDRKSQFPRLVPEDYHQIAFDGFTKTVQENAELFDRVRIVNRGGQVLFDSQKADNTQTAYEALQSGRKMDVQDWQDVKTGWERVIESAKQRGNTAEQYLTDITAHKNRVSAVLRAEKFKPEGMAEKTQTAKAENQRIKHKNHL